MTTFGPFTGTWSDPQGNRLVSGPDGVTFLAADRPVPAPDPAPAPAPSPVPAGVNVVRVGTSTYRLAAVDPTPANNLPGAAFPGCRGENQLVAYTSTGRAAGARTGTNQHGAEAVVLDGRFSGPITDGAAGGLMIPAGAVVLSGHGTARTWLLAAFSPGAAVVLEVGTVTPPVPDPPPGPGPSDGAGYPTAAVSIYKMMYPNSPAFALSTAPAGCNAVRLAFAVGNPPHLLGFGPEGQQTFLADVAAWSQAGKRVVASYGGAGNPTSTSDRASFLAGVDAIRRQLGGNLHGWDWDVETGGQSLDDLVYLSQAMKSSYGLGFGISFAPGDIALYLKAAAALAKVGALDEYGQQFYDATVSLADVRWRLQQAIDAGIPPEHLSVGMMIASDPKHWTNAQCVENLTAVRRQWPGITKAYLWEGGRAGTGQWAADMARIVRSTP